MRTLKFTLMSAVVLTGAFLAFAQGRQRTSPHETVTAEIDGNKLTLVYGRPYTKNPRSGEIRKIWGSSEEKALVPNGKVWRTGADEATLITTEKDIVIGDTTVPAGKYSVWTLPNEDGTAKLIFNKQVGQWGTNPDFKKVYDEKNDLGRFDLKKETLDKTVDQFTMAIEKNPSGGGVIKLSWEKTQFSLPFTVKK